MVFLTNGKVLNLGGVLVLMSKLMLLQGLGEELLMDLVGLGEVGCLAMENSLRGWHELGHQHHGVSWLIEDIFGTEKLRVVLLELLVALTHLRLDLGITSDKSSHFLYDSGYSSFDRLIGSIKSGEHCKRY